MVLSAFMDVPIGADGTTTQSYHVYPATQVPTHMMHTVNGVPVHGLIVDPGASAGLMGIDTLRLFLQETLDPLGLSVTIVPSSATFTGVDGLPEPSLGRCTVPLGVPGLDRVTFSTDLIGKSGSRCPGLLPLEALLQYKATLVCDVFEDKSRDGILILSSTQHGFTRTGLVRVHYTDSGHYLMPISNFVRDAAHEKEQAFLREVVLQHFSRITNSLGSPTKTVALHVDDSSAVNLHASRSEPQLHSQSTLRAGSGEGVISSNASLVAHTKVFRDRFVPEYLKADEATFRRFKNAIDPQFVEVWCKSGEKYTADVAFSLAFLREAEDI